MSTIKHFRIRRPDPETWNYLIEIADDGGARLQLSASFEDLDRIACAIEEQMAELVAAAECKGTQA